MSRDASADTDKNMLCHDIGAFDVCAVGRCGYGMVSARDLFQGTVVLRERPIAILRAEALQAAADEVWPTMSEFERQEWYRERSIHNELQAPPEVIQRFAQMEFEKCSPQEQERWYSLADAFATKEGSSAGGIVRTNSITDLDRGGDCYLFELLSRANHSCEPNMRFTLPAFAHDGGAVTLSMLRDVPKGSALTISYLSASDLERPVAERRALLQRKFNFVCQCDRCGPAGVSREDEHAGEVVAAATNVCAESAWLCGEVSDAGAEPSASTVKPEPKPRKAPKQQLEPLAVLEAAQAALGSHLQACVALLRDSTAPPPEQLVETVRACADALRATEAAKRAACSDATVR